MTRTRFCFARGYLRARALAESSTVNAAMSASANVRNASTIGAGICGNATPAPVSTTASAAIQNRRDVIKRLTTSIFLFPFPRAACPAPRNQNYSSGAGWEFNPLRSVLAAHTTRTDARFIIRLVRCAVSTSTRPRHFIQSPDTRPPRAACRVRFSAILGPAPFCRV